MKIIEEKNNELLNRKELKLLVEAEKNPSMSEALEKVSTHFKAEKDCVIIKAIKGKFGRNTFLISAFIYKSKEDLVKVEPKKKAGKEQVEEKMEAKT